jgi:hypothetical protein
VLELSELRVRAGGVAMTPRRKNLQLVPPRVVDAEVVETTADTVAPGEQLARPIVIEQALAPYVSARAQLEALAVRLSTYAATAAVITVSTPDTKTQAVSAMRDWQKDRADVVKMMTPIKQSIDRVKQAALTIEKKLLGFIDGPVAVLKGRVTEYDRVVARELEERRQAAIRAEQQRLRDEAAELDVLASIFDDAPAPLTEQAIAELALAADEPIAPATEQGFYYAPEPHFVVEDFAALAKAVAAGTVPLEALEPNESFIRKQVSAMGADLGYAGVRAWIEQVPRVRKSE